MLGQIEIIDGDGRRMTGDDLPRRARQVLGVLAARHDRVQSKDALADAVWGADLPGNATAALEHYVSVLRRALQPGVPTARSFIVTRAGGYVFATDRARLDLADLRAAAKLAERRPGQLDVRERIVDLAPELPFTEDEYADWAAPARAEVKAVLVAALLDLAEPAAGADPARALRLAREATDLEPFTERGYRLAMLAGAGLGRADEVVRWFDLCRRALADDLGIPPSADTTALRDRLLAELHTPGAPKTTVAGTPGSDGDGDRRTADRRKADRRRNTTKVADVTAAGGAPFVGRAAELAALTDGPGVIHVVGPAGAGKSALLGRLREEAPGRVGLGRGPGPGGALRLGWLRTVLHQLDSAADRTLDAAMGERRTLHPAELDAIAADLRGRVIAVDDAEHLDADSVSELRWLRERGSRVVVSYRYPTAIADRPLHALDADLVLRLDPLGESDLPGDVLAASGGIPALVRAVTGTHEGTDTGTDTGTDNGAHKGAEKELAEAVAMHLARQRTRWMAPAAWEILRLTAALGTLRVDQLAAIGGLDLDEVLAAVDRLIHAHLLAEGPGGSVRHRSDLVRSAVAAQISAAHGQHLRERLTTA